MKKIFLALPWALFLATASMANAAPDCWTTDGTATGKNAGGQDIADGQFLVTVDTNAISKEDLLQVIQKVHFGNLQPVNYPIQIQNALVFTTGATAGPAGAPPMQRSSLKVQVANQIDDIARIPGVKSVDCNGLNKPMPVYE